MGRVSGSERGCWRIGRSRVRLLRMLGSLLCSRFLVLLVSKNCNRENGSVESIGEEAGHDGEVIRGAVDVAC